MKKLYDFINEKIRRIVNYRSLIMNEEDMPYTITFCQTMNWFKRSEKAENHNMKMISCWQQDGFQKNRPYMQLQRR